MATCCRVECSLEMTEAVLSGSAVFDKSAL